MSSLDSFELNVAKLLEFLEGIIRGGNMRGNTVDMDVSKSLANELLRHVSTIQDVDLKDVHGHKKRDLAALAVKLNSKARALSSTSNASIIKLRNLAKAIAAWIVFQFHEPTVKSLQIVIPILGTVLFEIDIASIRQACCKGVFKAWEVLNQIESASTQISSLQMQDLKTFVFESLIEEARLLVETRSPESFQSSGSCIEKCIELAQTMNVCFTLTLAERILNFATAIAQSPVILDSSKHFFLSVLRILQSRESEFRDQKENVLKDVEMMKARASLALAYISIENGFVMRHVTIISCFYILLTFS